MMHGAYSVQLGGMFWSNKSTEGKYTVAASECAFYTIVALPGKSLRNARNKHHPEDRGITFTRNVYNHMVSPSTMPPSKQIYAAF